MIDLNPDEMMPFSLTPLALKQLIESAPNAIQLIDVRESYEREICHIGGTLMPLSTLATAMHQLSKSDPIVIYCKSGIRSLSALHLFINAGFKQVQHLEGGILNWQAMIDDSLIRY